MIRETRERESKFSPAAVHANFHKQDQSRPIWLFYQNLQQYRKRYDGDTLNICFNNKSFSQTKTFGNNTGSILFCVLYYRFDRKTLEKDALLALYRLKEMPTGLALAFLGKGAGWGVL